MFLRPQEFLRISKYSIRSYILFLNSRDFHVTHCAYLRSRRKIVEGRENESSLSVAGEFPVCVPPKKINDNFYGIESDEGVMKIDSKPSLKNNSTRQSFINVEQEKFIGTSFGTVRYDSDNKPKHHGQLEKEKVLISANVDKDKIFNFNQTLLKKNSNNTEAFNRESNFKSKLPSSSYVDEIYFPDSHTQEENKISNLEGSPSSANDNKLNFIEESYFSDKITSEPIFKDVNITSGNICNHPLPDQEESAERTTDHKLSSFQSMSELKSSRSSNDNKSNFIEEAFFEDKMADESIFKNVNMSLENISNTDKNHPLNENPTEFIADDKQSSFNSRDAKLSTGDLLNAHEIETNMKTLYDLNESVEEINAGNNDEQLSLKLNYPSVEDLEGYNKFISGTTDLPKKKNNFLFQSNEFLKKSELTDSKSSSRVKKLRTFQRNLDGTDTAGKIQNEEEQVKSSLERQNLKVAKGVGVKNSNAEEQPETASDFVKKLRSTKRKLNPELINGKFMPKKEQTDSKGFRILKNQVPDLKYYTSDEILDLLVKNVLYSDDDLIVLNKPYNLVMHESKTTKDPCLSQYLDDLAAELDRKTHKPKLITVHRLDKETSGCLLLARNEISAQRLLSFFSQRKIIKTYWIVTTKVPEPLEGIIDMSISEGSVNGRVRMVLHPDLPKDIPYRNHSKSGKRAVTHYKVIAESGNAALVEVKPETGVKHQIRVHFGFGLSCPILGDHKYSHLDKLVPQKLQSDLLQRLHVQQSKVRYIPMHIYARSIFIPQYKDERNLFVMAPMPIHMSKNLQKLKFRKK